MSEFARKLSIVLLVAVLGLCVYRARTQSLTIDEAWVFQLYVNQPLAEFTRFYDASNHVLHTLAMKLCRWMLGTGELALRLPSLLAAAFYFRAVYLLTRMLFRPWMQVFATGALVLHPLVLDFFVAARGYGLALALFTWSLYLVIAYFTKGPDRFRLSAAGILAGLAIAANLTLLMPVAALGLMLMVLLWREGLLRGFWGAVDSYGGPALVIALLFLIFPLRMMTREHLYFGTDSLLQTSHSLVEAAVKAPVRSVSYPLLVAINPVAYFLVPALVWILGAAALIVGWRYFRAEHPSFRLAPFLLVAGTLVVSIALSFAAHLATGAPYPLHRTGLYLIPLFTLALLLGLQFLPQRSVGVVFAVVITAAHISQIDTRYFAIWRFDASMSKLMRELNDDYAARGIRTPARVAASGVVSRSAGYYKMRRRMDWLSVSETPKVSDADYYLLTGDDRGLVATMNLRVLDDDALSGTLLARRVQ